MIPNLMKRRAILFLKEITPDPEKRKSLTVMKTTRVTMKKRTANMRSLWEVMRKVERIGMNLKRKQEEVRFF